MTDILQPVDPADDHLIIQSQWDLIVERAEQLYLERVAEGGGGAGDLDPMGLTPVYKNYPNSPYDKSSALTKAQVHVIHTAECPLRVGYAASMTEWADGDSYNPRVSWQRFVDPATVARFIPLNEAGWHAQGFNAFSTGYEQSGYASYSRAQWLSPDGLRQIDLLAQEIVKNGLPASGIRILTESQLKAIKAGDRSIYGLASHAVISKLFGGNNRTDPGSSYPWDILLDWIDFYHPDTGTVTPPTPPKPVPVPPLAEDGKWGEATTRKLQRVFGTKVDGEVSNQTYSIRDANPGLKARTAWEFNGSRDGSGLIRAMQRWLKAKGLYAGTIDGLAGPMFWRGFYKNLGVTWDGNIDNPDPAIKKMQYRLNRGTYKN